ncbi:hypothetical protein C2869_18145 [Saccharobesus litoralis]|uniref:Ancillary SecYEG translocon subunit n=1 Tax=Saccharobesus litoralis TaxID=2172099 RepID=A0A2S0VVJ4_9ALTE|nr:tetratricopeptide repeat protein [Saccharobesus litoralis]AWB68215.1 hypothetical protein C2869_18145 [Saccharobesus litoralis]
METYTTEEQQVEAIKKFWKENGVSIIVGIVAGLGGVGGYKWYQGEVVAKKEAASTAYDAAVKDLSADNTTQVESFIKDNAGSGYAELASLMLAKTLVEAGELDKAASQLEWVVKNASKPEVKALANYRLARIQVAQEKLDAALALTNQTFPESFSAQISELQGDIYLKQGNLEKARESYQAAADSDGLQGNPALQMKLDDLAVNSQVVGL